MKTYHFLPVSAKFCGFKKHNYEETTFYLSDDKEYLFYITKGI